MTGWPKRARSLSGALVEHAIVEGSRTALCGCKTEPLPLYPHDFSAASSWACRNCAASVARQVIPQKEQQ